MKRFLPLLVFSFFALYAFAQKPLYGKVRVVTSHADFKVRVVDNFADLNVRVVDNFADECGEWQFVDYHEDFTIQFVDYHEDFSIKYVDFNPGLPSGKSRLKQANKTSSSSSSASSATASSSKTPTASGGYVESVGTTPVRIIVPDMSVKQIGNRWFFSVPRFKNRWFSTSARVQLVDSNTEADLVFEETYNLDCANLYIEKTDSLLTQNLQWQMVDTLADYTIRYPRKGEKADVSVFFKPSWVENQKSRFVKTNEKWLYIDL